MMSLGSGGPGGWHRPECIHFAVGRNDAVDTEQADVGVVVLIQHHMIFDGVLTCVGFKDQDFAVANGRDIAPFGQIADAFFPWQDMIA